MSEPASAASRRGTDAAQSTRRAEAAEANRLVQPRRVETANDDAGGQTRLAAYSARTETPAIRDRARVAEVTPERRAEIDRFVDDNAGATTSRFLGLGTDHKGGERVAEALRGASSLGRLTTSEQAYLSERSVAVWQQSHARENVDEAVAAVRGDAAASRALATALAAPEADAQRHFATGGTYLERPGAGGFRAHMRDAAIGLDPAATVAAFAGAEMQLGRAAATSGSAEIQRALLGAVSRGRVPAEAADRLVTSMFVHGTEGTIDRETGRMMGAALAALRHPGTSANDAAARELTARRLSDVLGSDGGRRLLLSETVAPEMRAWAFEQVATNRSWTADALASGWESDAVTSAFARQNADRYAMLGPDGVGMSGQVLRNTVGQALNLTPDRLPAEGESAAARDARLAAGAAHQYYGDDSHAARIAGVIEAEGGPGARISVVPVTVTNNEVGPLTTVVFRVERADGSVGFVDNQGKRYDDLGHWRDANELPPGRMVIPEGLRPGAPLLAPGNTRLVTDTFWEWAGRIGDGVALGVGIVAGAAVIVGTGGTAAILAAGAAGAYMAGRAGHELHEDHRRGVDVLDFSNPETRGRWLELAAGTLSLGAIGGGLRLAGMAARGSQVPAHLSRGVAGLTVAADLVDGAAMLDQSVQLGQNWDRMSNADRAMGMLNVAFWGGVMAASARSSGAGMQEAFSFRGLDNQLRTGTPYPMAEGAGMAPGEIRVAYDLGPGGRAGNVRIETGPGPVDRAMLDLHTRTARQIEAAGGLHDRLAAMMGGRTAPVGSAAWEARLEIDKIGAEARSIATELGQPGLTAVRRGELETRQRELDAALGREGERLAAASAAGNGWIAAPSRGAEQARALGWADAPDGHAWVAGDGGTPILYRADGSLPPREFDPVAGEFTERYRRGESSNLNPDLNPPANDVSQPLAPNLRIEYDNGQVFETDAQGRVSRAEADLAIDPWVRDGRSQAAYGNLGTPPADFDGGHLLARLFGGAPDRINVVPMDSTLNQRGPWRQMEQDWERMLQDGQDVRVEIDVIYPDGGGPVPERFRIVETVDGVSSEPRVLWNTPDGRPAS